MKNMKIAAFKIIGISVRTTNENGQASTDIPALWNRFMTEGILDKIPNKINNEIYAIYTEYESDHTKPYTTILGCSVENFDEIPEGMLAKTFDSGSYTEFLAKGDLIKGNAIYNKWMEIWNTNLDRTYTADFEIYGEKAQDPSNAEVAIFIGVKE